MFADNLRVLVMLGLCGVVFAAGPLLDVHGADSIGEVPLPDLPDLSGCVASPELDVPAWPQIPQADSRMQAVYRCGSTIVSVDVAGFVDQRPGKEAVSVTNKVVDTRFVSAARPAVKRVGDALSVRTYHLDRGIEPGVLWSWYAIGRTPAAGPMQAKLLEVGHAAIFSRPGATIFTIAAWGDSRRTATELVLEDAARDVWTWYLQQ